MIDESKNIELTVGNYLERSKIAIELANNPKVQAKICDWAAYYEIRLISYFYENKVEERYVQYPSSWWQAFKEAFTPIWARKYIPVNYTSHYFVNTNVYPSIKLHDKEHLSIPLILETKRTYKDHGEV